MTDTERIAQLVQENEALAKALEPFVSFLKAFEERPIRGLDTEQIYAIHGGKYVEGGAYLGWKHLRDAKAALAEYAKRKSHAGSSSPFLGVHFYRPRGNWRAQITKDRKMKTLGYFKDEVDAATAYNFAAFEAHGEFARFNTPQMADNR